jgi:hypothetical protein
LNTALPPDRDVPPYRRAQIRATLEREVARSRRPVRFAPLIAAGVATAAVIALVTVVAPWRAPDTVDPAGDGSSRPPFPTTAPPRTYSNAERPVFPDLPPERIAEIEAGCLQTTGIHDKAVLHQYITDATGTFALLYTDHAVVTCTVDGPGMPYNPGFSSGLEIEWLPGEFAVDSLTSAAGGDGGKPEYAGKPGYDLAVGRVSAKVAKVTVAWGGETVEATIANGTFVARVIHASDYRIPEDRGLADVRAYDAEGNLLGTLDTISGERCYARPDHLIVAGNRDADPTTCWPAVLWRL